MLADEPSYNPHGAFQKRNVKPTRIGTRIKLEFADQKFASGPYRQPCVVVQHDSDVAIPPAHYSISGENVLPYGNRQD